MDFDDKIEDYLNKTLSEAERQAFEQALTEDAALRQNVEEHRILFDLTRRDRLKMKIAAIVDKLPVAEPQIVADTEGGKIVPLQPSSLKLVKKNRIWWVAAAASVALVVAVGMWFYQKETVQMPQQIAVQTPPPPIDTLKKIDVPKSENPIVEVPKETPQYPKQKDVKKEILQENTPQLPTNSVEKAEELETNEQIYAEIKTILAPDLNANTTMGSVTRAVKNLSDALDAFVENKPNDVLEILKKDDNPKAEFYRAMATLLTNRADGKAQLQAIAADEKGDFSAEAKRLLKKLK